MNNLSAATPEENNKNAANEASVINFKYGLPGFETLSRFSLADVEDFPPFQMLYSIDEENFSLLVLSLSVLNIEKQLKTLVNELKVKGVSPEDNEIFLVLKLDRNKKVFTANIKAPLIVSRSALQGSQLILDHPDLPVDFVLNKV